MYQILKPLLITLVASFTLSAQNIYVDQNAPGSNNGTDWVNAYIDLQDALTTAMPGDTIFVAQGTYYPTATTDRTIAFQIPDSVVVLGGYDASDGSRDIAIHTTILSGDIGTAGDSTDNSYHVVYTHDVSEATIVDGFAITNGFADGGLVENFGGGWYNNGSGSGNTCDPIISNCTFTGNHAFFNGGAMYITNGNPIISNCIFTGNSANSGGAIFNNYYSNSTFTACTFSGNVCNYDGGAIFINFNSDPSFLGCTFSSNTSDEGGAMYNSNSNPTITNCTFSGNTPNYGGAMYNINSSPMITNCSFTHNKVNNNGGAMFNSNSNPIIADCTFYGNRANIYGGAMINGSSNPTITNCIFSNDTAIIYGGAIYNGNCNPIFTHCVFNENIADLRGGAMHNSLSNPTITNCTFSDNICNNDGGAIFNDFSSRPAITNSLLSGNEAHAGGAIFNYNQGNPVFTNCSFFENTANHEGGAICNELNSYPDLANCILWGDSATNSGDEIHNRFGTSSTVTYTLITGGHAGDGNLDEDPLFVDAALGDLHLLPCSPAINTGINDSIPAGINTDLDSIVRIWNSTVDMGAYEYVDSVCCGYVNTTADQGHGSLPVVLGCTLPGDTVRFHPSLANDTITLTSDWLLISDDKVLIADPLANITIDASQISRAFEIASGVIFTIGGLDIISGTASEGGAFYVSGSLIILDTIVLKK